jgi:hypothetical protein
MWKKHKCQKRKTNITNFKKTSMITMKKKIYYKFQECHQSIYGRITNLKEKQSTSNPKIPMTMKKKI